MSKRTDVERAILLLSCPDRRGIVAEIAHFISLYEGNILESEQHHDPENGIFFQRIEWDITAFAVPKEKIARAFEPIAEKFGMQWRIEFSGTRLRSAIFVSKYDHCLYDLLLRNRAGELNTEIALIVSNHPDAREIADHFRIPFEAFDVTKDNKAEVERRQIALLTERKIDLVVLARYMQILSADFVRVFPNRIVNIHHSFLPAFVGASPYHQAYARGVKIIGATSHYVTESLDEGPIIEQDVVRISHRDSVPDLVQKGKNLEKLVLSRAVRLHLEHRVLVYGGKTVVFG